ncbi:MAG: transcriptional regulator NrdR [bacterium]
MKCPFCASLQNRVIDSRLSKDHNVIRRRRECLGCTKRFTTYERIEEVLPLVIKRDGRREPFDRAKIISGMKRACEKRPISINTIERAVEKIEQSFQEKGEKEIPSERIGERVMEELHQIDEVAYVRFASVYRHFKDVTDFMNEVSKFIKGSPREDG